jgi:isopentenyl-diphosphate delta-isomerase
MSAERKDEHLDIVLSGRGRGPARAGWDDVRFAHVALPEIDLAAVDLSTTFLGRPSRPPSSSAP